MNSRRRSWEPNPSGQPALQPSPSPRPSEWPASVSVSGFAGGSPTQHSAGFLSLSRSRFSWTHSENPRASALRWEIVPLKMTSLRRLWRSHAESRRMSCWAAGEPAGAEQWHPGDRELSGTLWRWHSEDQKRGSVHSRGLSPSSSRWGIPYNISKYMRIFDVCCW